jgi:hypothetical protein
MGKSFDWQQFTVPALRSVVRRLRRRAILFKIHHFNSRETKQDLVRLLDSLFEWAGSRGGLDYLVHRRLKFELYHSHSRFFLDPRYSQEL